MSSLCDSAITSLIESQSPNLSLVGLLVDEAGNIIADNIKRMEAEQYSSDLLRYRVLYYLNQQKRSLDRFRGYLGACGADAADNIAAPAPYAEKSTAATANAIEGVAGLAKYLGCGMNKAQDICNSGLLKKNGIQYSVGRKWIFNRKKWKRILRQIQRPLPAFVGEKISTLFSICKKEKRCKLLVVTLLQRFFAERARVDNSALPRASLQNKKSIAVATLVSYARCLMSASCRRHLAYEKSNA